MSKMSISMFNSQNLHCSVHVSNVYSKYVQFSKPTCSLLVSNVYFKCILFSRPTHMFQFPSPLLSNSPILTQPNSLDQAFLQDVSCTYRVLRLGTEFFPFDHNIILTEISSIPNFSDWIFLFFDLWHYFEWITSFQQFIYLTHIIILYKHHQNWSIWYHYI